MSQVLFASMNFLQKKDEILMYLHIHIHIHIQFPVLHPSLLLFLYLLIAV